MCVSDYSVILFGFAVGWWFVATDQIARLFVNQRWMDADTERVIVRHLGAYV